jgi:hypothetical protein
VSEHRQSHRPAVARSLPAHLHDLRFYDLRHTAASILIANGVDFKAVSERLGHSSITITLDRSVHPYKENDSASSRRSKRPTTRPSVLSPQPTPPWSTSKTASWVTVRKAAHVALLSWSQCVRTRAPSPRVRPRTTSRGTP